MTSASLDAQNLRIDINGQTVIHDISLTAACGEIVGIVGPNGSGKSTLLRALARILPTAAGSISINRTDITQFPSRLLAQTVAAVLQDNIGDFDLLARDVVALGRAPFKRMFQRDSADDAEIIDRSLALVDATHLLNRLFTMMSGGERQRVLIARALAQQPQLLLLDEPTNHLDIRHQFEILALPATLGITAIIALHDLNLAAHFCDRLYLVNAGRLISAGPPEHVLTRATLAEVYGVQASVGSHPETGRAHIMFDPRIRLAAGNGRRDFLKPECRQFEGQLLSRSEHPPEQT